MLSSSRLQPTTSPTTDCLPRASKLKLQSLTHSRIQVFEVEVYSLGNNVAAGKISSQSTTYKDKANFAAGSAVDGNNTTFSHTAGRDKLSWWEVDLGGMFSIESVKILNRWCQNLSDPTGCLCRLSHAAVLLFDDQHKWVHGTIIGNMCGKLVYENNFTASAEYCMTY